jgi:glucose-6-phosphate isomerase
MTIRIDYSNMMGDAAGGISESDWNAAQSRFDSAFSGFRGLRESGTVGFADIVSDASLRDRALGFAGQSKGRYTDIVILGIGGSALGPIALRTALRPAGWNMLSDERRGGYPRLHVLDNVDPETIEALLDRLDLSKSLFIVTSKSGGTAETMSQFLIVQDMLRRGSHPIDGHVVFVTDPAHGALRPLAAELKVPALDIPPSVGGRFSVLTPVGTLPAALIGIDIE